jgi:hypothetical protein
MPIFLKDWWIDAVVDGASWDVVVIKKNDEILAAMPYVIKKRWGGNYILMPKLTQFLGPWFRPLEAKYSNRLSKQMGQMEDILDRLPVFSHFQQNWHYSQTNWLPFYWRGFNQTTRYTYIIEDLEDLNRVWHNFSSSYRNKIRKAEKSLTVKHGLCIDEFYKINEMTFLRQGLAIPYSYKFLKKHEDALKRHNSRMIFYAVDETGAMHSALYLIWDGMSSYIHMVGDNPDLRNSGAGILLIWEAIKFTKEELRLNKVDFEGSMIRNVERVRRDCGAKQIPYYRISKTSSRWLRLIKCFKELSF